MTTIHLVDNILQAIANTNISHENIQYQTADLTMDDLSIWIQNKQLLEKFNDEQLKCVQNDVINHVFGGLRALLNLVLDRLPLNIQHKLFIALSDAAETLDVVDNNNDTQIAIDDLPMNIASYTMRFLTSTDRYYSQQVCRYFAIAARHESSVNGINELSLMGIVPHKKTIVQCFSSEDPTDNIRAINLCLKYRKEFPEIGPKSLLQNIFRYQTNFNEQVEKVLIRDGSTASKTLFAHEFCNLAQYYLNELRVRSLQLMLQKMKDTWKQMYTIMDSNFDAGDLFTPFVRRIVRNGNTDLALLFGVNISRKKPLDFNEYKNWRREYLCGHIDVMVYTYWTKEVCESYDSDYTMDVKCKKVVIPAYMNAISTKTGTDYRQLVHCLSKDQLKIIYKLFKEVDYGEAQKLNKAFLNRNKS